MMIIKNTRVISLDSHQIETLKVGDFSGLTNLYSISLEDNAIETIEDGTFLNLTSLVCLRLRYNKLSVLGQDVFLGLHKLETLKLGSNSELILQPCALSPLTQLITLDLWNTNVSFELDLFTGENCSNGVVPFLGQLNILNSATERITSNLISNISHVREFLFGRDGIVIEEGSLHHFLHLERLGVAYLPFSFFCDDNVGSPFPMLSTLIISNIDYFTKGILQNNNLRNLMYRDSSFTHLPADAFLGTPSLESLGFVYNRLTTIHRDAFKGLARLKELRFSHNLLTSLPEGLFAHTPSLSNVYLNDNQWLCDCGIKWLITFLDDKNPDNAGRCSSPAELAGTEFVDLSIEQITNFENCNNTATTQETEVDLPLMCSTTTPVPTLTVIRSQSPTSAIGTPDFPKTFVLLGFGLGVLTLVILATIACFIRKCLTKIADHCKTEEPNTENAQEPNIYYTEVDENTNGGDVELRDISDRVPHVYDHRIHNDAMDSEYTRQIYRQ
ncbi:uncharacterized protein [Apostichopus japonicus]|uniref:uncharacterized protein isoform X2 n=1 Tax=Stichopus japonicus TaxID=307972 RepID=UPI003AB1F98D